MCEFSQKGLFFSHSRWLPIEGMFYLRTNSAFSIRYISENDLQEIKNVTSCQDGTKRKTSGMGQNEPYQNEKSNKQMHILPCGQNVHAVLLHT